MLTWTNLVWALVVLVFFHIGFRLGGSNITYAHLWWHWVPNFMRGWFGGDPNSKP